MQNLGGIKSSAISENARTQHRLILEKLGPMPQASLAAMAGYGLSEQEIGHYFGITPCSITRLKRVLHIAE